MSVTVIGDINVDLELVLPGAGPQGREHAHPEPVLSGGGSAANTAAALSRLGFPTKFVGTVGADAYGAEAVASLARAGVDIDAVSVSTNGVTVVVVVVVPPDGERLIYVWPPRGGAHLELDEDQAITAARSASWLHVSGIGLRGEPAAGAMLTSMGEARAAGATVSLDLNLRLENWGWDSDFKKTIWAAVESCDVVFGGAIDELCPLAGVGDPIEAAASLAATADRLVVGRLGAEGSIAQFGDRLSRADGFEVKVVDTVGAGDAFDAGFIAARLRGDSVDDALRYANAVAALTIARPGARATPVPDEVVALIGT